jgi:urease gamma subunit
MAQRFTSRDLGTELIIHDGQTDSIHILSKTARLVYEMIRAGRTVDDVVEAMKRSYVVAGDQDVLADVTKCLEDLRAKQLLD